MNQATFWIALPAAATFCGVLLRIAWLEPSSGDFWDDNNPSGFHRFVPPLFACLVAIFLLGIIYQMNASSGRMERQIKQYEKMR